MTKQRKLICYGPFCYPKRIKHDRNKLITHNRKHYCKKCWTFIVKQRQHRWRLYGYIEDKAHIPYPNGIMLKDIKTLNKERHYTYQGILNALRYANKFSLKFNFRGSFFIRYVPYVYEKAQKYLYEKSRQNDLALNVNQINNEIDHASVHHKVFEPKKKLPHYDLNKF